MVRRFGLSRASILLALAALLVTSSPVFANSLHQAVRSGDLNAVRAALDDGDAVNGEEGEALVSPLHVAAQNGFARIAGILLDAGAFVNIRSRDGHTPLHAAAMMGHESAVDLLIARGAEINAVSLDGSTPLHLAAFAGSEPAVRSLVRAGAATSIRDFHGQTAAALARSKGFEAIAEIAKPVDRDSTPSIYRDGTLDIEKRLAALRANRVASSEDAPTAGERPGQTAEASPAAAQSAEDLLAAAETAIRDMRTESVERPSPGTAPVRPLPRVTSTDGAPQHAAQLASVPTRERAEAEWSRLKTAFPDLLGHFTGEILTADLGEKGVRYRVRTDALTRDEGRALCEILAAREQPCLVVRR